MNKIMDEKYYQPSQEFMNFFKEVWSRFTYDNQVTPEVIGNSSMKTLVKASKIPGQYAYLTGSDVLIQVNEDYYDKLDNDEATRILLEQELNRIHHSVNGKGIEKIEVKSHDFNSGTGLMNKWGAEPVYRANVLLKELIDQQEDDDELLG